MLTSQSHSLPSLQTCRQSHLCSVTTSVTPMVSHNSETLFSNASATMVDTSPASPCTPPSKSQLQLPPDTIPIHRFTSLSEYRSGDLSLGRQAVLRDVGKYIQVPYATLIGLIFGSPPSNIPEIRKSLADSGVLKVASQGTTLQWAGFEVAPGQSNIPESDTFQPLVGVVSKIFSQTPDCNFSFISKPSTTPLSERQGTARPDAYVVCNRATNQDENPAANWIHWFDIAIPLEFKKNNLPRSQQDVRGSPFFRNLPHKPYHFRTSKRSCGTCTVSCARTLFDALP